MENPSYLKNVVTLEYDAGKCTGCGRCAEVCPHAVFSMDGEKARLGDRDACMECGACARNCPFGAISVKAGVGCAWALTIVELGLSKTPSCG
jgi:ferredoxin